MRVIGCYKQTERLNESEGARSSKRARALREDDRRSRPAVRTPEASIAPIREPRRARSTDAGTRKMVNYAWSGRSQGKP